jgi:formylglycine-generating enzyme required for sulfatase activity
MGGIVQVQANNISVSNVSAKNNNAASSHLMVNFNVSWENSWRRNTVSGSISYLGLNAKGSGYTGTPLVYIGSNGAVAWQANTAVTIGQMLVVSATPNRYYIVTAGHTTQGSAPTHTTGTTDNLLFVTVSDGGGSGATATARVSGVAPNEITGFNLTNAGSGYTSDPTVTIAPTNGGTGGSAEAYVTSWWDAAWVFVKYRIGYNDPTFTGVNSSGTTITVSSTDNLRVGMPVRVTAGTGVFAANSVISSILSSTQFTVSATPTTTLSNASITCLRIWEHATLNTSSLNHVAPTGSTISVPSDGKGAFIYRSDTGSGTFSLSAVQLRWNYGDDGVRNGAVIQLQVHAVEMVYVPQGSYYLGNTGSDDWYSFTDGSWTTGAGTPYLVNTEGAIGIDNAAGKLWATTNGASPAPTTMTIIGNNTSDAEATLDAAFPKGYNAFYCMKYELTQAQYRDFLNTLTYNQQTKMVLLPCSLTVINKYVMHRGSTLSPAYLANGLSTRRVCTAATLTPAVIGCNLNGSAGFNGIHNASNDGMWTACNFLPWRMSAAYLDWAGLRPMTEMELEKASRGSQYPVANEGAMGIIVYHPTSFQDYGLNAGTATQGSTNPSFYHACGTRPINSGATDFRYGPFRVGSFAKSNSSRQSSGASFWGIMDLTGNVHENTVSVANGRSFTGNHGDGTLSSNGYANATAWPGLSSGEVTGTTGIMPRGGGVFGNHWDPQYSMRNPISSRYWVSYSWPTFPGCGDMFAGLELSNPGNRGVRTAP